MPMLQDPRTPEEASLRFGASTIVVRVGTVPDQRDFCVHEDIISPSSVFFSAAINGPWLESQQRVVCMPEDRPAVFNIYMQWLYSRKIITCVNYKAMDYCKVAKPLVLAYILGEKLQDIAFQDTVADALIAMSSIVVEGSFWYPNIKMREMLYKGTTPGCRLRQFAVDTMVWHGDVKWLNNYDPGALTEEAAGFLLDLGKALLEGRTKPKAAQSPIRDENTCRYHQHKLRGLPCYKHTGSEGAESQDETSSTVEGDNGSAAGND